MMQAFLMAAHEEGDGNKVVKMWVKQVRDVAYNVEDTLQDFAVSLDRHRQSWWRIPRTLLDRRHVAKQMKELKADVEDVSQRSMRYHLIKGSGSGSKPAAGGGQSAVVGETMSGVEESRRQQEKSKVNLVRLINKRNGNNLKVFGVWATSTVDLELEGSTSIIKRAYDHLKRHGKFNSCAYLRLMCTTFNRMEFIQNIIRQFYVCLLQESKASEQASMEAQILRRMGMNKEEEDDLIDEFKGYLKEKSYLIVLMDVSSIEQWDQIKTLFPHNKRGSRIMVFTSQVEVATSCAGPESLEPEHKQLSSDDTFYAFYEQDYLDEEISPDAGPAPNATTSGINNSMDRNGLTRTGTMVFTALEESQLIGRVNERSNIIQLVSNNDGQEFQVISLWGMGGLGKTTLVRDIYQSQEISQMFEARACATVMRPFNCEELLRSLAMQFGNVTDLRGYLDGKKYLIVLDDISSAAEFNAIIQHLPKMAGSCIIVTTREESIAQHCSDVEGNVRKLSTLNYDDAHILLMRKVFKETVNLDDELVEQEGLILKKCKGLPLAIVAIGGFLANQPKTAIEWRKFNQHLSTELEMNPELETIRAVLLKSYDGLPYHLKSCFLYLAIFPEDHEVRKRRLVRRWIAEGYSREMRGKSAEEMASSYFMEFLSRSMILPSQRSMYSRKGMNSCQIHDMIREIIISKSMEENLVLRLERGCIVDCQGIARHLVISSDWEGDQSEFESTVDLSRIRSFTVFGESKPFFISNKMKLLRVLDLEGVSGLYDHHLVHMGKLLHLKYLSLRGCSELYHLPDWLGNLRQLETLDIKGTRIFKLPRTIIRLTKLRHICAGISIRGCEDIPDVSRLCSMPLYFMLCCLDCCRPRFLNKIVPKIGAVWNRRDICTAFCCGILPALLMHLSAVGVAIPTGIHKLKALQTLDAVDIIRGKATLDDIERLPQLRNLGVSGINKTNGQMLCSAVAGLNRLESLTIKSSNESGMRGCLDGTVSPPKNLKRLKLMGNLGKLPEWTVELKNLMKLKLWSSRILEHDSAIQVLGKLPNLTFLSLRYQSFVGEQVRIKFPREEFPSLVVLEVYLQEEVKSFEFEGGATPKLELLRYCGYPSQCTIGYFVGVQYLHSLREFKLSDYYRYSESEHKDDFLGDLQAQISQNTNRPVLNRAFNFH